MSTILTPEAPANSTVSSAEAEAPVATQVAAATTEAPASPAASSEVSLDQVEAAKPAEAKPSEPVVYDLKLPEGAILDQARVEEIASFAKEQGFSNETAQKILERENALVQTYKERETETYNSMAAEWQTQLEKDPEFGGENFKKNSELAHRALAKYASEDFKKQLEATQLGNHPELVKIFLKIGKEMAPDTLVTSRAQAGRTKSPEEIFYPDNPKE